MLFAVNRYPIAGRNQVSPVIGQELQINSPIFDFPHTSVRGIYGASKSPSEYRGLHQFTTWKVGLFSCYTI